MSENIPKTMKALVKSRPEPGLWLEEVPTPDIGINDVLIRVLRASICGTDLHILKWDAWASKTIPVPMVVGHEFVGEVVKVGSNVTDFFPGQLVGAEGHVVCGLEMIFSLRNRLRILAPITPEPVPKTKATSPRPMTSIVFTVRNLSACMVEPMATVSTTITTFITSLAAVLASREDQHFSEQVAEHQHRDQRRHRRQQQVDENADHDREGDFLEAGDFRDCFMRIMRSAGVVNNLITGG